MKIFNVRAFIYHFLFSFVLIGGLSLFVVKLWYPGVWASELGGYKLVLMILALDLGVGPLCVGFVYKQHKSIKEKVLDISVITLCQLAFFLWGAYTVSISRPVYIVFDTDRFELVVDQDIDRARLPESGLFSDVPLLSTLKIAVLDLETTVPDENERIEVNNDAVFGLDVSKFPQYYVAFNDQSIDKILRKANDYEAYSKNPEYKSLADVFIKKHNMTEADFKWLAVRYFSPQNQEQMFITAVIDGKTAEIIDYIVLDPYEI